MATALVAAPALAAGAPLRSRAAPGAATGARPTVIPGIGEVTAPASGQTSTLVVPVTLDQPSTEVVTAHWSTLAVLDGPDVPEPQAPATDHEAASGTVVFAPGSTSASVSFAITGDAAGQFEYVVVSFTAPTHAAMGGYWGLGFGLIDPFGVDPTPRMDLPIEIGATTGPYPTTVVGTLDLDHPSSTPVAVDWATTSFGTVQHFQYAYVPGTDYTAASGRVVFPPGSVHATVEVHVNSPGYEPLPPFPPLIAVPYIGIQVANPSGLTLGSSGGGLFLR